MKSSQVSARTLALLRRQLQQHGIRHEDVAAEAAKTSPRGSVSGSMVSRVLSGRSKSANVVATVRRLISEAKCRQQDGEAA